MIKRQGDFLVIKIKDIPPGAVKQSHRVLAEGEATGHRHELSEGDVYEKNGILFFHVETEKAVTLTHPEHHPITFSPGVYKVVRQKEYEPGIWRYVTD